MFPMRADACRMLLLAGLALPGAPPVRAAGDAEGMARLPDTTLALPFREKARASTDDPASDALRPERVFVRAFRMDKRAVTTSEFLDFVRAHPGYARSRIAATFADKGYLRTWEDDFKPPQAAAHIPVTAVSWYAAKAYCSAQGKRLPTTAEWERAAATFPEVERGGNASDSAARERAILTWYAHPDAGKSGDGGTGTRHAGGISGLYGVIWEWTADFNAWSGSGVNARGVRAEESDSASGGLFCGGAPANMMPNTSYATYMRWAFRASLSSEYTVATLGFRCARDATPNEGKSP